MLSQFSEPLFLVLLSVFDFFNLFFDFVFLCKSIVYNLNFLVYFNYKFALLDAEGPFVSNHDTFFLTIHYSNEMEPHYRVVEHVMLSWKSCD